MRTPRRFFRALRFVLSSKNETESGAREFLAGNLKKLESELGRGKVVVRECEGADEHLIAEYDFGVEQKVPLQGLSTSSISEALTALRHKSQEVNSTV